MGQAESNESAAVKRQAEGGAIPMYELLDLGGMRFFILINSLCKAKLNVLFLGQEVFEVHRV